jgi:hypothetical protein
MSVKTTYDRRNWDKVLSNAKDLNLKPSVDAGFPPGGKLGSPSRKGSGHKPWKSMLELAYIMGVHEMGRKDGVIPMRSHIRKAMTRHEKDIQSAQAIVGTKILIGELSLKEGLSFLGHTMVEYIKNEIRSMKTPVLKKATIKAKGNADLLRDTEQAINSVSYVANVFRDRNTDIIPNIPTTGRSKSKGRSKQTARHSATRVTHYNTTSSTQILKGANVRNVISRIVSQVRKNAR